MMDVTEGLSELSQEELITIAKFLKITQTACIISDIDLSIPITMVANADPILKGIIEDYSTIAKKLNRLHDKQIAESN